MIDIDKEKPLIQEQSTLHNVDWRFVLAIRQQENGGPGIEFGVFDGVSNDYNSQLIETCKTVAHRFVQYCASFFNGMYLGAGRVVVYSDQFIEFFGRIWAPPGAPNDPQGLNSNWVPNVTKFYHALCNTQNT